MHEAAQLAAPNLSMWVTFALIIGTLGLYAVERFPVEVTSVGVLGVFIACCVPVASFIATTSVKVPPVSMAIRRFIPCPSRSMAALTAHIFISVMWIWYSNKSKQAPIYCQHLTPTAFNANAQMSYDSALNMTFRE